MTQDEDFEITAFITPHNGVYHINFDMPKQITVVDSESFDGRICSCTSDCDTHPLTADATITLTPDCKEWYLASGTLVDCYCTLHGDYILLNDSVFFPSPSTPEKFITYHYKEREKATYPSGEFNLEVAEERSFEDYNGFVTTHSSITLILNITPITDTPNGNLLFYAPQDYQKSYEQLSNDLQQS